MSKQTTQTDREEMTDALVHRYCQRRLSDDTDRAIDKAVEEAAFRLRRQMLADAHARAGAIECKPGQVMAAKYLVAPACPTAARTCNSRVASVSARAC